MLDLDGNKAQISFASGGLAGEPGGPWPPADFFEGPPKFTRGAKNFMKFDGSITFFQHHVAGYTGIPY